MTGFLCPSPLLASQTASQSGIGIDGSEQEALEGWESGNLLTHDTEYFQQPCPSVQRGKQSPERLSDLSQLVRTEVLIAIMTVNIYWANSLKPQNNPLE